MPDHAHITSVEALGTFRDSLIVYLSKTRPALEEVYGEVTRTRLWLEQEQRPHWEGEVRRRRLLLERAQQALFSARMSNTHGAPDAEETAVRRARLAVEEAETKLKRVRVWTRDYESRVEPTARRLGPLMNVLTTTLPEAVAYLDQTIRNLDQYLDAARPSIRMRGGEESSGGEDDRVSGESPSARETEGTAGGEEK